MVDREKKCSGSATTCSLERIAFSSPSAKVVYVIWVMNSLQAKWSDFLVQKTLKLICYIRVKEKTAFKACWKEKMYLHIHRWKRYRPLLINRKRSNLTYPKTYERLILSLSCLSLCMDPKLSNCLLFRRTLTGEWNSNSISWKEKRTGWKWDRSPSPRN